ncbi:MAG TPA: pyruvate formate lyase family protein, partial [Clostridia bacterium]|nr:pyruvate formate lyase family protein [Clostridia bacterium]
MDAGQQEPVHPLFHQPPDRFPDPFLSALTRDCIGRGRDLNDGGAEFPRLHGVGMMGLGTLTDSLSAIRKLVYDEKSVTPERLLAALGSNFS